jgi:hypothetical protein
MNILKDSKRVQIHLTLDVTYAPTGDTVEAMRDLLVDGAKNAISHSLRWWASDQPAVETFSVDVSVANEPRKVFVATYEHRHGEDQRVFATEAQADAWKNALGTEYWAEELSDKPLPADASTIGTEYFNAMSDASRPEYFNVEALEVESN